jgi:thiol-disulfide isomerase/thioredoxin
MRSLPLDGPGGWFTLIALTLVLGVMAACGGADGTSESAKQEGPCRDAMLSVGDEAPELRLVGPDGEQEVSLRELADGKLVLLDVWATWCKPCIEAMPHLQKMHSQYSDQGFAVVGVMSDANATRIGPDWVAEQELGYPMMYDENSEGLICQWGPIPGYPTLFLLDRDGTVLEVFRGTGDVTRIEERVAEVVAGGGETAAGGEDAAGERAAAS